MGAYQRNCSVPYECTLGVLGRDLVTMSDLDFSLPRRPLQGVRSQTLEQAHPAEISSQLKTWPPFVGVTISPSSTTNHPTHPSAVLRAHPTNRKFSTT